MKKESKYFIVLILIMILTSCGTSDNPGFKVKHTALGIMNDIVVVCDQDVWDSIIGDSLDYYYGGAYPITPSPEPIFDLRHFTPKELIDQPLRKELRTYLILSDMNSTTSSTTEMVIEDLSKSNISDPLQEKPSMSTIGKDKWAHGQILVYILADGFDNLASAIGEHFSTISTRIRQHDDKQLTQSTYSRGSNSGLSRKVEDLIGTSIDIPFDYVVAKEVEEENLIWLRKDTKDATLNLILRKEIYTDQEQTSKEHMKALKDDIGRKHISSIENNTYMRVNDKDLPILEYNKDFNGLYAKEYRGIWEMENDFMGGPYHTWMVVNGDELIYVDGFVWSPGKRKREMLQQLEKIVSSLNRS
tara:strand:- start:1211 stop:2287 length:1077 start_codon:yes stop_codon:yes gene_type:complete